jgi:hypothetical protein
VLLQLLLAVSQCVPPGPSDALGLWESAPGSSGFGTAIELRADGTFLETMTVMVDMTYRVSAEGLIIAAEATVDAGNVQAIPFKVTRTTFTYRHGRRKVKMVRIGAAPDPTNLVLGSWRFRHYTGGTAFEKYLPSGQLLFRLPFPGVETGCFTVSKGAVLLSYPQGPFVLQQTAIDVLKHGEEEDDILRRTAGGPWYPLTANDRR